MPPRARTGAGADAPEGGTRGRRAGGVPEAAVAVPGGAREAQGAAPRGDGLVGGLEPEQRRPAKGAPAPKGHREPGPTPAPRPHPHTAWHDSLWPRPFPLAPTLARTLALILAVAPTQARARHLEEQLETQHHELQEIIASKREERIGKLQLTAARSAQQLESCRARGAAAAFDRHAKYDATYGRALQRRDDSLCMRQGQISDMYGRSRAGRMGCFCGGSSVTLRRHSTPTASCGRRARRVCTRSGAFWEIAGR